MSHFHGGSVSASSTELDTSGSVMFNQSNGSPKRHNEVNGKDDITDSMMPMKEGLYTREEEHDEHDGHHSYNSFINGKLCHIDSSNQDLDCIKRSKIDAESRSPKSHNNKRKFGAVTEHADVAAESLGTPFTTTWRDRIGSCTSQDSNSSSALLIDEDREISYKKRNFGAVSKHADVAAESLGTPFTTTWRDRIGSSSSQDSNSSSALLIDEDREISYKRIAEGKAHQEFIPVGRPEELLSPAFRQAHSIEESRIRSRSRSPLSRKANRDWWDNEGKQYQELVPGGRSKELSNGCVAGGVMGSIYCRKGQGETELYECNSSDGVMSLVCQGKDEAYFAVKTLSTGHGSHKFPASLFGVEGARALAYLTAEYRSHPDLTQQRLDREVLSKVSDLGNFIVSLYIETPTVPLTQQYSLIPPVTVAKSGDRVMMRYWSRGCSGHRECNSICFGTKIYGKARAEILAYFAGVLRLNVLRSALSARSHQPGSPNRNQIAEVTPLLHTFTSLLVDLLSYNY